MLGCSPSGIAVTDEPRAGAAVVVQLLRGRSDRRRERPPHGADGSTEDSTADRRTMITDAPTWMIPLRAPAEHADLEGRCPRRDWDAVRRWHVIVALPGLPTMDTIQLEAGRRLRRRFLLIAASRVRRPNRYSSMVSQLSPSRSRSRARQTVGTVKQPTSAASTIARSADHVAEGGGDLADGLGDGGEVLAQDLGVVARDLRAHLEVRVAGEYRIEVVRPCSISPVGARGCHPWPATNRTGQVTRSRIGTLAAAISLNSMLTSACWSAVIRAARPSRAAIGNNNRHRRNIFRIRSRPASPVTPTGKASTHTTPTTRSGFRSAQCPARMPP